LTLVLELIHKEQMITALCIGDPHFRLENIREVEMFTDLVVELATIRKPTFIVLLGDILHDHEKINTVAMNHAYDLIRKLRDIAPLYVLVGNHDACTNQIFLSDHHWLNGMKEWRGVTIVDRVVTAEIQDEFFTFVPYVPPGRFFEALDTNPVWKSSKCIFAHQEFHAAKLGAIISDVGDKWNTDLPYVISGHIHSKQTLESGVFYTGSALQVAFGENEHVTVTLASFSECKIPNLDNIDLGLPRKRILYTDSGSVADIIIPETEGDIKVSVSGNSEEFKLFKKTKKYKDLVDSGIKVVFKQTRAEVIARKDEVISRVESALQGKCELTEVIEQIVKARKDKYVFQVYEEIVNDRKCDPDDFLIF